MNQADELPRARFARRDAVLLAAIVAILVGVFMTWEAWYGPQARLEAGLARAYLEATRDCPDDVDLPKEAVEDLGRRAEEVLVAAWVREPPLPTPPGAEGWDRRRFATARCVHVRAFGESAPHAAAGFARVVAAAALGELTATLRAVGAKAAGPPTLTLAHYGVELRIELRSRVFTPEEVDP